MALVSGDSKNVTWTVLYFEIGPYFSATLFLFKCTEHLTRERQTVSWKLKKNVNESTNVNPNSQNLTLQFATRSAFVPFEVYKGMFESVKLDNPFSGDAASTGSAWVFGSKSGYLSYWAVLTSVFSHYGMDNSKFSPLIRAQLVC